MNDEHHPLAPAIHTARDVGQMCWATTGAGTKETAHLHCDGTDRRAVVHNGIIDNDLTLTIKEIT